MPSDTPAQRADGTTFMAVIGHADAPHLLRRCIDHHLAIGVDRIFISLNGDDDESVAVAADYPTDRVKAAPLHSHAPNALHFMTSALEAALQWSSADWVLFLDSDEFWVPEGGAIRFIRGLEDTDLFVVERYNAPPLLRADGAVGGTDPIGPSTPIFGKSSIRAKTFVVSPEANPPWIRCAIGPKVMVRTGLVERVGEGGHGVALNVAEPRTRTPGDLLIVHLPFTDRERFQRKVEAITALFVEHAAYDHPKAPPHWRRWVEVAAQGLLDVEFDIQGVPAADVEVLKKAQVLITPADLFNGPRAR